MMGTNEGVTLTLTVHDKFLRPTSSNENFGGSSPKGIPTFPMTVSEGETRRFRLPWSNTNHGNSLENEAKRLEKEREAEKYIESLSGRSLTIQRGMVEKVLNKEKRKVKFGLSSSKIMDLAIRRYTYKLSELERDIQLESNFDKCPEEFGFVLRHVATRFRISAEAQKFRQLYWDTHGRNLDLSRVMYDNTTDMARKRQLVLERIPRKKLHPENSHLWWDEDENGNLTPSRDHVEWICWGFTPDVEEVGRICKRIARMQPPDLETVRLYRAQAILAT